MGREPRFQWQGTSLRKDIRDIADSALASVLKGAGQEGKENLVNTVCACVKKFHLHPY